MNPRERFEIIQAFDKFWIRDNSPDALNRLSSPRATRAEAEKKLAAVIEEWEHTLALARASDTRAK